MLKPFSAIFNANLANTDVDRYAINSVRYSIAYVLYRQKHYCKILALQEKRTVAAVLAQFRSFCYSFLSNILKYFTFLCRLTTTIHQAIYVLTRDTLSKQYFNRSDNDLDRIILAHDEGNSVATIRKDFRNWLNASGLSLRLVSFRIIDIENCIYWDLLLTADKLLDLEKIFRKYLAKSTR